MMSALFVATFQYLQCILGTRTLLISLNDKAKFIKRRNCLFGSDKKCLLFSVLHAKAKRFHVAEIDNRDFAHYLLLKLISDKTETDLRVR